MSTLETAISNLRGKAQVADDRATHHLDRAKYHRQQAEIFTAEALKYTTALEAIHEVMGTKPEPTPNKLPSLAEEAKAVEPHPFRLNGAGPSPVVTLDRDTIRRELKARHIFYPVARSHRDVANFVRQSLITACADHPDYQTYIEAGGYDLMHNLNRHGKKLRHAVETLGVDKQKVTDDASVLHKLIFSHGVEGVDYR